MDIYSYFKSTWKHLKDFFYKKSIEQKESSIDHTKPEISLEADCSKPVEKSAHSITGEFSSRVLLFILKKTKIYDLFEKYVSDPRRTLSTTYSSSSLLMYGLLTHLLRQRSKNAFHDAQKLSPHLSLNIADLIHAPSMPCPKTAEDLFINLECKDLDPILPDLFRQLLRHKFFQLHPEFKAGCDSQGRQRPFLIAIDAQITHTYYDDNQHPVASCPYCLKRTRDKASWYVHCDVTLSILGEKGFQFPLFLYRVKANHRWEVDDSKKFKQECELSALPKLLEKFRHYFPHLKADLLLDSLYAHATAMELCHQFHLGYLIVRKSGSLRSLNSEIEGLKKLQTQMEHFSHQGRWDKQQIAYVFPSLSHKKHSFTLIELYEKLTKTASKRLAKVNEKSSHWQWIVSQAVKIDEVFQIAHRGRLRWHQEDFFNTLNNRGFNLSHDFSRSPHSQTIWHTLMFIAFALSTLMQLSSMGYLSRQKTAIRNWIESIFSELCSLSSDLLWKDPLPKQLRFWFDTS